MEPKPAGDKYRVYFCSYDDSQPLGQHVNSLVEGATPFAYAIVPPIPAVSNVTNFSISGQMWTVWYQDGSMVAHATINEHLPHHRFRGTSPMTSAMRACTCIW